MENVSDLALLIVLIVAISIFYYFIVRYSVKKSKRGQFGDMFGGLNALFSGLAFAFVIYSLIIARTDIKRERFENTFFNLLSHHHQTIENLTYDGKIIGRTAFEWSFNNLNKTLESTVSLTASRKEFYEDLNTSYFYYYLGEKRVMENYYNSLSNLLSFIETSNEIDPQRKMFYYSIVVNEMSFFEKIDLYYYIGLYREPHNSALRQIERKYKFLNDVFDIHICRDWEDGYILYYAGVYDESDLPENDVFPREK
jgi:hypothetical protein